MIETHKRSILKALTWRGIGVIFTIMVAFFFTKKVALSVSIGSIDALIKLFAYYFHERAWNKVSFGRAKVQHRR